VLLQVDVKTVGKPVDVHVSEATPPPPPSADGTLVESDPKVTDFVKNIVHFSPCHQDFITHCLPLWCWPTTPPKGVNTYTIKAACGARALILLRTWSITMEKSCKGVKVRKSLMMPLVHGGTRSVVDEPKLLALMRRHLCSEACSEANWTERV
jgi:hypothetical protein